MRFNEKWAEYCTGAGPLQVRLLGKNSLLSSEAIVDQKERTICEFKKNLKISNMKTPIPQPY
jgi:hypothetical protein